MTLFSSRFSNVLPDGLGLVQFLTLHSWGIGLGPWSSEGSN